MLRRPRENFVLFLIGSDLFLTLLALSIATRIRLILPYGQPLGPQAVDLEPVLYGLVAVIWLLGFASLSAWDWTRAPRLNEEIKRVVLAVLVSTLLLAGSLYLTFRELSRLLFIYFFLIDLAFLITFRITLSAAVQRLGLFAHQRKRVLIIGAGNTGRELARLIQKQEDTGLQLVGLVDENPPKRGGTPNEVPILGTLHEGPQLVREQQVDEVIFALPLRAHRKLLNTVAQFERLPINLRVVPDLLDLAFFRATVEDFYGIPLIGLRDPLLTPAQRVVKRAFDLVVSIVLLLLLWPAMLVIALLIKFDSPGSIIFIQPRVGENGRIFRMYKFRTMDPDAERRLAEVLQETPSGKPLHKAPEDPRVTHLGRFLRRTSLDELPQLFNVLKGEMSLVGPRPEMPFLVDRYEPWQWKRFAVPQGITGWWQVNGRSDRPMHLHTEDDLWYIQNYSLWLDLVILWRTLGVVLKRQGAY